MQAINLEAKLEAKLRAVLFAGTAFAIFGQKGPIQGPLSSDLRKF